MKHYITFFEVFVIKNVKSTDQFNAALRSSDVLHCRYMLLVSPSIVLPLWMQYDYIPNPLSPFYLTTLNISIELTQSLLHSVFVKTLQTYLFEDCLELTYIWMNTYY